MTGTEAHSYDVRGRDLRQLYASFGRRPLSDEQVWALSLACSTLLPGHIGYKAWITYVADVDAHGEELADWAKDLARCMATARPLLNKRRRVLISSYAKHWGDQAALDGLALALYGPTVLTPCATRAAEFGCHRASYKRVRDLIGGAVLLQLAQFEDALGWAVWVQRRG